jgi:cytochrome c-type biogenesis protein CcmF
VPIAIFLLFLTGVGPLLAWRKASTNSLKRNFLWPAAVSLAAGVVLFFLGVDHFYAWISIVMSIFVGVSITREFYKGARARSSGTGENFAEAVMNLTLRNKRRYGGYIVHFGFVLLFIGWAGQAFTTDIQAEAGVGDTVAMRQYVLRVDKLGIEETANYTTSKAAISLFENGEKVGVLYPERRFYTASGQPTTEVAIWSTIKEDLYVVFAGPAADGKKAILQVYLNPLVAWVWIGGIILGLGTLIAMLPNKKSAPRLSQASRRVAEKDEVEQHVS